MRLYFLAVVDPKIVRFIKPIYQDQDTTFTILCLSPIWTILLRDLARSGGYSIQLFNSM